MSWRELVVKGWGREVGGCAELGGELLGLGYAFAPDKVDICALGEAGEFACQR